MRLLERFAFDPAGVVFAVEFVAGEFGAGLLAVKLVVHAVEWERFDLGAGGDVEIGVFIPTIDVKEELAKVSRWSGGKRSGGEFEGEFVTGVDERETFVAAGDEFGNIAVASAPSTGNEGPWTVG